MRTLLFITFTWGVIVGIPVACFLATRALWPAAHVLIPAGISVAVFLVAILSGEWLARFVNAALDKVFTQRDA